MDSNDVQQAHRHFAAEAFNSCWELIGLAKRTKIQDREMIRRAEVSFWHWQQVDDRSPENDADRKALAGDLEEIRGLC